jgi:hypothetical protein
VCFPLLAGGRVVIDGRHAPEGSDGLRAYARASRAVDRGALRWRCAHGSCPRENEPAGRTDRLHCLYVEPEALQGPDDEAATRQFMLQGRIRSAARELSPADLALASEQELAAAQRDWGSLPEYLLAGSRVDVHASCGLSSLCDEGALRLVQDPSVLGE